MDNYELLTTTDPSRPGSRYPTRTIHHHLAENSEPVEVKVDVTVAVNMNGRLHCGPRHCCAAAVYMSEAGMNELLLYYFHRALCHREHRHFLVYPHGHHHFYLFLLKLLAGLQGDCLASPMQTYSLSAIQTLHLRNCCDS